MLKVFLYFLGIFLTSLGIFFTILYCNVLTMGYSLGQMGNFIIRKIEFWFILWGIILILLSLERWIKNELLLRCNFKLGRR